MECLCNTFGIYELARPARTLPKLEEAGLLSDPAMTLEMRRPADVLIKLVREGGEGPQTWAPVERLAIDVKWINACGRDRMWQEGPVDPQRSLGRYEKRA